jgi:tetratricopeptide (TPR) repeat protein
VKISIDDYKDAERLASKLIETAQKTGNTEMIAAGYYNLGAIYQATQNMATGLQMHKKAVDIAEANGHKREMVNGYLQMAYCYEWLEEKEECERAIDRAIEICTQANAQTYVNALLAHKLSFKCLEISDKEYIETFERLRGECSIEDIVGQDAYWWMLANYYAAKGDRARALEYADSIEDETNRKWARQCVYIRLKDWESAYKFGEMMVEWQDSVKAITQSETMAEKDAELNNVKLRLEKAELETHNRIILFGSLGAIVLLIVGVVIVNGIAKRRRLQEQKRLLEEEVRRKTAELVKKNKELED